jgi:sodium-coupled neutral amino acid transporter 10
MVGKDQQSDYQSLNSPREEEEGTASVTASVLNLVNNVVGAGLFSMPWCLFQSTVGMGLVLIFTMALLNTLSFVILAECCELAGTFNYRELGRKALGDRAGTFIQSCMLCYTIGSCVSYVVLTGDFLADEDTGVLQVWAYGTFIDHRGTCMIVVGIFVITPLCFLKNLEPLKYTSLVSFCGVLYATFLVVSAYTHSESYLEEHGVVSSTYAAAHAPGAPKAVMLGMTSGLWRALPIFNVAFTAHYNAPQLYLELERRTPARFALVVSLAMGFAAVVYATVAVCGYLTFRSATLGDVLENFNKAYPEAIAGRLALAFVVVCTFPLANFSLRESIITLWTGGKFTTRTLPFSSFAPLTIGIIACALTVGILITKVEVVLAYKGAIFGSCIVYILPSLMYLSLRRKYGANPEYQEKSLLNGFFSGAHLGNRFGCVDDANKDKPLLNDELNEFGGVELGMWTLLLWGVITGVLGVSMTILKQSGH